MTLFRYTLTAAMTVVLVSPLAAATKAPRAKPAETITCREFIALDDEFKPHVVSYALGYDKGTRPDAEVIDVTGVNKVVPIIITACQDHPDDSLLARIRADLHPR